MFWRHISDVIFVRIVAFDTGISVLIVTHVPLTKLFVYDGRRLLLSTVYIYIYMKNI